MIARYLASLATAVFLVTLVVISLPYVVRSCVPVGDTVSEDVRLEFTFDADSDHTYQIGSAMAQRLETYVRFPTEGAIRVLDSKAEVAPQDITWHEGNTKITSAGAVMTVQLRWSAPSDAKDGDKGSIYVEFPKFLFEGKAPNFHGGQYQIVKDGRCLIREVAVYRSPTLLYLARFRYALAGGLPFGILLHTIGWAFVLKRERRRRLANLPAQGPGLPQTFYPNPTQHLSTGLVLLGIGAGIASLMAGVSIFDNFVSSTFMWVVSIILALAIILASVAVYLTARSAVTVRIDRGGVSYVRGRKNSVWVTAAWDEVLTVVEKSRTYRGNTTYWIEIEFKDDNRKTLKIDASTEGYAELRRLLF